MTDLRQVAVLFARADSIYKTLPGCDVWDIERDARKWPSGAPVVAHPPCRAWGRMRGFASKVRPDEKALAPWAVDRVRQNGGILEHPAHSTLWKFKKMPPPDWHPGMPNISFEDEWGGFTIEIKQFDFGHKAEKKTWLYIVGLRDIPFHSRRNGKPTHCIRPTKSYPRLPSVTKPERERTPPRLAEWLVELARRCQRPRIHA